MQFINFANHWVRIGCVRLKQPNDGGLMKTNKWCISGYGSLCISTNNLYYQSCPISSMSNQASEDAGRCLEKNQAKESRSFQQDIFIIDYLNSSKIIYHQPQIELGVNVKIKNYLCYQNDNDLRKVTEIIYEDKLVRIEDRLKVKIDEKLANRQIVEVVPEEKVESPASNVGKVRLFNQRSGLDNGSEKKDKRNIVKNVVKIFLSWAENRGSSERERWRLVLSALRDLIRREHFNNRLIMKMVQNQLIRKPFRIFLTTDAEEQIKYSRIKDKKAHHEAIQLYLQLLDKNEQEKLEGSIRQ